MPFFIPYNINLEEIEYEIIFTDIGMNHNTIVYPGKFKFDTINANEGFGNIFNYKYFLIDEPLSGVNYG